MFVHYRTVSYQMEKTKEMTGINFDSANEVLTVSNGLVIYKMLNQQNRKRKRNHGQGMFSFLYVGHVA